MTVILSQQVGNEGRVRTCSGTCHKAKGPKCACICGGKYHGCAVGKDHAPMNVEEAEAMRPRPKHTVLDEEHGAADDVAERGLEQPTYEDPLPPEVDEGPRG